MRFAALVAGVCLGFGWPGQSRAESPLEHLLASVRVAGGTPYVYHLRASLSEIEDGIPRQHVLELEGTRRFLQHCEGLACHGLFTDGQRSFETDSNGTAVPGGGSLSLFDTSLQGVLLEEFADPGFRTQGGSIALLEPAESNGTTYPRMRVSVRLGSPVDVTIDPHTYLVTSVEDPRHRVTFVYPSERGALPALPSQIVWAGRNAWTQHFSEWAIVDGPLALPPGLVPVFAGPDTIAKMLPTGRGPVMPVVECTIGGHTVTALLDTGDSNIAMSLELAEELGVEPSGGALAIHGIGQYATGLASGPGFAIGAVAFPAAKFALLHDIHRYGYDLVLGADVFAHVRVTLDYAKQEVRFSPASDVVAPKDALQIHFENFIPVAQAWLGATPAALALDTGDEASVNLAGDFYARNPSLFAPTASLLVSGVGGNSTQLIGTIPSVTLARFEVRRQKIGATKGLNATADGHLGSGFLAHFITTFDYAHARVELVPRGGDTAVSSVPSSSQ
jgi:hypothetical protein